jgi:hypothetical protein
MGLTLEERPIRGGTSPPGPAHHGRRPNGPQRAHVGAGCPPWPAGHVGISPTWLSQGRWSPPSTYIYGCHLALEIHQKFLSLSHLERDSAIGVALGLRFLSTICTPPCCWSSGPSLLLPLLVPGSEPGGRHLHRMCATPCEAPHVGC